MHTPCTVISSRGALACIASPTPATSNLSYPPPCPLTCLSLPASQAPMRLLHPRMRTGTRHPSTQQPPSRLRLRAHASAQRCPARAPASLPEPSNTRRRLLDLKPTGSLCSGARALSAHHSPKILVLEISSTCHLDRLDIGARRRGGVCLAR